jgi:hypothetical protein
MSNEYPHLTREYDGYAKAIIAEAGQKAQAVAA